MEHSDGGHPVKRVLSYIAATVTGPRQGFMLILFDAKGLAATTGLLAAFAVAWAVVFLGLASAGFEPWAPPWLTIPSTQYYAWEALFVTPVVFAGWLIASGFAQIVSHRGGGAGSFEATAKLLALSIAVPMLVLLIPALLVTALAVSGHIGAMWWVAEPRAGGAVTWVALILVLAEAVWMTVLVSTAVRAAHKIRPRRSFLIAIPATILYHAFVLVFVR